jgi:predicted nucleic acid-binding protein
MIAFDTSFLIDYLDEQPVAEEFSEQHRDQPLHAPAQALFEAYRGGARTQGEAGVDRVRRALEFLEPLPFSEAAADRAARVEAQLLADGNDINVADVVVAGTCLHHGADLVTDDRHFDHVDGLEVIRYDA